MMIKVIMIIKIMMVIIILTIKIIRIIIFNNNKNLKKKTALNVNSAKKLFFAIK